MVIQNVYINKGLFSKEIRAAPAAASTEWNGAKGSRQNLETFHSAHPSGSPILSIHGCFLGKVILLKQSSLWTCFNTSPLKLWVDGRMERKTWNFHIKACFSKETTDKFLAICPLISDLCLLCTFAHCCPCMCPKFQEYDFYCTWLFVSYDTTCYSTFCLEKWAAEANKIP